MRSPCCGAAIETIVSPYCTKCGQPCDPVEASEKDATLSHPDGCSEGEK